VEAANAVGEVPNAARGDAGAPLDSAREAMQALVNASLVEWNESNGRFRLHDLVRQFCEEKLREADANAPASDLRPLTSEHTARFRHAWHYCAVGEEADRLYLQGGEKVLRGLELFDAERPHLEAAFEWLEPCRDHESAALLVSLVKGITHTGLMLRLHPRQHIRWSEAQLRAACSAGDRRAEANALRSLGDAHIDLGEARRAIEFYDQGSARGRQCAE
jgi:tetratricopeptide (TPR) repeat protein